MVTDIFLETIVEIENPYIGKLKSGKSESTLQIEQILMAPSQFFAVRVNFLIEQFRFIQICFKTVLFSSREKWKDVILLEPVSILQIALLRSNFGLKIENDFKLFSLRFLSFSEPYAT